MLMVIADVYDALDLAARRDWYRCAQYEYAIASHEKSGVVVMLPHRRELKVSSSPTDYSRIRVLNEDGELLGVMECATDGRVSWTRTS